ncbi:MAG: EF-hand domain-containing protein [Pirellulaceae bacterium]|nr:EF-hand domain-containing protein [Pirellulaceae bacterium]
MFHRSIQLVIFSGIIAVPGLLFAQPPGRGGPQGGMRGGPPTEMILQLFQQADTNNDGSVSRAELTAAMQNQARGDRPERGGPPQGERRGRGGPPPHEGGERAHGQHGPPPQPGQVLPEQVADSLNLDVRQKRQLAALQADVDKRLAAILTDEQKAQLQNARPAHGPGHVDGEQGDRPAGRPQRPQRPE